MPVVIHHPGGILDLDPEFTLDIELTNPIYSDRGSMTIPATLPSSLSNRKILENAHRLDVANTPDKDVRVVISDGAYRRSGKLNILTAGRKSGITINVGFDEGEMYSLFEDTPLSQLNWIVGKYESSAAAAQHLQSVMREEVNANYRVFPIQTSSSTINNVKRRELLNEIKFNSTTAKWDLVYGMSRNNNIDNVDVESARVPVGYGCTPFLKVHYVLEQIFSLFGYRLIENPFESLRQLKRMVILNNVADTIVKGEINYADLLPDCTINEFLHSLYVRMGMQYFVDGSTKTVRIILIADVIANPNVDRWKEYIASDPTISYAQPQQLVLSAGTTFEGAAPQQETINKFLAQYNHKFVVDRSIVNATGELVSEDVAEGESSLYYENRTGRYFEYELLSKKLKFKSSDFFPWDLSDDNLDKHELTSIDESVPMSMIKWGDTESLIPSYLAGYRHYHTTLGHGENEDSDGSTPLSFCFCMPFESLPYGSIYPYDSAGVTILGWKIALTFTGVHGAFAQFWHRYDAILRFANSTIECDVHVPKHKLFSLDMSKGILIDGQRLLIESLQHSLPLSPSNPTKVKLRTLKLLQPYDLSVQVVTTGKPWFKWVINTDMQKHVDMHFEFWVKTNGYDINKCWCRIEDETEYPEDGDFPLKPPGSIDDHPLRNDYKLKAIFGRQGTSITNVFEGTYPVTATPEYTKYWAYDHPFRK